MKNPILCKDCKQKVDEDEIELNWEDDRYHGLCTNCRMEKEIAGVIEGMRFDFPKVDDYNVIEEADESNPVYAEILDKNDKRIGTISERQLTRYWNMMEGG